MPTFQDLLKEIDQLLGAYKARRPLSPEDQAARYEKLRLEWTYHSNAIEGNSLTLSETQFYLREGLTSEGKPFADYVAAKNHAEAIDWLFDYARGRKPITAGFIKDLNALLHKGITTQSALGGGGQRIAREISPGAYKIRPNHVLTLSGEIHYYVDPLQVPGEMEKLVQMIQTEEGKTHPVELAAAAHYDFTRIHPFDDCNGRGARLLLNLILMRAGFPPIVIKIEERRRYIEALETGDKGNREPFYVFVAEHVRQSLQ
ncbi:Fic family protein [Candidatus Uhrbacteria bacterium]|nr:Fic family protein [Candidatus Uhrbacteria bacterium]